MKTRRQEGKSRYLGAVAVMLVLCGSVWYVRSTSGAGEEQCVARDWTMFRKTCRSLGPDECTGGCYRLRYDNCNDCIQGSSSCDPPISQCWVVFSSTTCVKVAGGGCICAGNWTTKITAGAQICD